MEETKNKILVDGNCIVCDKEVAHYKRMKPSAFEIVDISDSRFSASSLNLETQAVNKHLHVLMPNGIVLKGVPAFLEILKALGPEHPHFQRLRNFFSLSFIRPFVNISYEIFAYLRPWLPKKRGTL